jgi:hypothetical protein
MNNIESSSAFWLLNRLSDDALLASLGSLMKASRGVTARMIAHLGEVEERRLHLRAACSSMFVYCTERLHLSEDEACRRIKAARIARRFPLAYELLASGAMGLSVLCLLKEHVTEENHEELFAGVSGKRVRQAEEWLAARFPRPDAPSIIRKLPERPTPAPVDKAEPLAIAIAPTVPAPARAPAAPRLPAPASACGSAPALAPVPTAGSTSTPASPAAPSRSRIEPLSEARYKVQFTASRELKDKLDLARDLMSHAQPGADLAVIVERALDLLVAHLKKKRFGETERHQRPRGSRADRVTSSTRRAVVERDGLSCSYVDERGRRCGERAFLQIEHVIARARGGGSHAGNLRLFCAGHNRLMAELELGREHVTRAIADRARGRPERAPPG